ASTTRAARGGGRAAGGTGGASALVVDPGEPGDTPVEGGVVEPAVAVGTGGAHQLGDDRCGRDRDAGLAGRRGDDPQVLVVQVDAEPGVEVVVEHLAGLLVEHGGSRQAAAEDLDGGVEVDPVGLQEHDRLGERLDVDGDDQLVRGLDGLAGAVR